MIRYFKVDLREPYMGNTLVTGAVIATGAQKDGSLLIRVVLVLSGDSMTHLMREITLDEFNELFNR